MQAERDKLEETRRSLEKRLEGCEAELRGKEDELFLQLERSLRLEEEVERAKTERDSCIAAKDRLERQREVALRRLQMQLAQNEITRQTLERARQDVVKQATVIRAERDALEREVMIIRATASLSMKTIDAIMSYCVCFVSLEWSFKREAAYRTGRIGRGKAKTRGRCRSADSRNDYVETRRETSSCSDSTRYVLPPSTTVFRLFIREAHFCRDRWLSRRVSGPNRPAPIVDNEVKAFIFTFIKFLNVSVEIFSSAFKRRCRIYVPGCDLAQRPRHRCRVDRGPVHRWPIEK